MEEFDAVPMVRKVLFVGDYFSLITTVVLDETLRGSSLGAREDVETDDDFAIRLASTWLEEYYGWDIAEASNEIGVIED